MNDDLPMPSDVKREAPASAASTIDPVIEPPSFKLLGQLFIIPLFIVAGAVGIMFLIGIFAGMIGLPESSTNRAPAPRSASVISGSGRASTSSAVG